MSSGPTKINWKLIAFWVALWWFVYRAPTEGSFSQLLTSADMADQADTF
jgi:hypothetical protein